MSEMPKHYDPHEIEGPLYQKWYEGGYFSRDAAGYADPEMAPYTIVIPPPNVTGTLHMGHALNETIQDTCIRRARMQGHPTRWITGTDHAGIATQNKVEQKLAAEGKTRFDVGRDAFVDECWKWRDEKGSTIIEQLKGMGCSCDYDNEKFTMDPHYQDAIRKVFCDWYKAGLVYRGNRIINWCPRCTTALADDEVEHEDEQGHLWHLRYPLTEPVDGIEYLVVATTRPETMMGDTGVAVHPEDERYKNLIGKTVMLPIMDREIPIFADEYVDKEFGTGCVKVTPAHDPNDFEMGQRHNLETINVFTENAVVNADGGPFVGMSREEAREAVIARFEELGLLDHIEDHEHAVGHCYRCNTTIEPWLSDQWFVSMKPLAEPAIKVVREGKVTFHPKRWENVYFNWLENVRDWCISRQLWWGHRIPVFYCDECGWMDASETDITVCPQCGAATRQDEDVLDTWFSSQLWPFATFGWPCEEVPEAIAPNYPTQVLSTARDIIFLWVARMVMSSLYFMDEIPFQDVIIHPTVLDHLGRRMSKSLGNGIDPLDLIDRFGADGMRFGLLLQVTGAQDMKFDEEKLESSRNFATKIWNAARFVLMNLEDYQACGPVEPAPETDADRWILSRLAKVAADLDDGRSGYDFGAVAREIYDFFWGDFCDWYIEFAKGRLNAGGAERATVQQNLVFVLDKALRLLHPMMPFVTEEIWGRIPHGDSAPMLMVARYPKGSDLACYIDEEAEGSIALACEIISAARSTRARYGLSPKQSLAVAVKASAEDIDAIERQRDLIMKLANLESFQVAADLEKPAQSASTIVAGMEIYLVLEGLVDFEAEKARLMKERDKLAGDAQRLEKKLSNEAFLAKAAPDVVEKAQQQAAEVAATLAALDQQIAALG